MSRKLSKIVLAILIIGVGVTIAWWGGAATGKYLDQSRREERRQERKTRTQVTLERMETIAVGEKLPDYEFFENLASEPLRLSEKVDRPTWLIFMLPDCDACIAEIQELQSELNTFTADGQFIVISGGNPLDLMDIRKEFGLTCLILHDRHNTYIDGIKVNSYPFNVLIDKDLVIKEIIADELGREDLR